LLIDFLLKIKSWELGMCIIIEKEKKWASLIPSNLFENL
jgi:hypothetical protein